MNFLVFSSLILVMKQTSDPIDGARLHRSVIPSYFVYIVFGLTVDLIGIPHMSTEEDVYEGYQIPKGAVVIPNAW